MASLESVPAVPRGPGPGRPGRHLHEPKGGAARRIFLSRGNARPNRDRVGQAENPNIAPAGRAGMNGGQRRQFLGRITVAAGGHFLASSTSTGAPGNSSEVDRPRA